MSKVFSIGQAPWSREEMLEKLEEFAILYESRPLKDNRCGMRSPHMFLVWFALQSLKPKAIIESGVWRGLGTWFFEKACPDAELYCIDLDLSQIQYKSKRARYFSQDFSTIDWNHLPKRDTVLFLDDHQNAYERLKIAHWFGFKHLIFEDNYPAAQGDCYSLKKCFMHAGFKASPAPLQSGKARLKQRIIKMLGADNQNNSQDVPPNDIDAKYLQENLKTYAELPPVFKTKLTRWNDPWDDEKYPTPEPLLDSVEKQYQQIYLDEATFYTWMCYVSLK